MNPNKTMGCLISIPSNSKSVQPYKEIPPATVNKLHKFCEPNCLVQLLDKKYNSESFG